MRRSEPRLNLPCFLGCPSWDDAAWRGSLWPPGLPASGYLARYCSVFNTVEGNTALYAWPSVQTIERWAARMPEGFRFCAKLPRAGKRPHVYLHTPDNRLAPELAMRFHEQLSGRLPGLPPLAAPPMQTDQSQLSLFGVAGEG